MFGGAIEEVRQRGEEKVLAQAQGEGVGVRMEHQRVSFCAKEVSLQVLVIGIT